MHDERLMLAERHWDDRKIERSTYILWAQEALAEPRLDEGRRIRWEALIAKQDQQQIGPLGLTSYWR